MGVERVDYSSEEEYQQAKQFEEWQEQQFMEEQLAQKEMEELYWNEACEFCGYPRYNCQCGRQ